MECREVALGFEWADDAVGRDAFTDHGVRLSCSGGPSFACNGKGFYLG